tara:strand:+ start:1962 stop:2174 length:213 start_codon:yes stop_codon:yes gene_type:complete
LNDNELWYLEIGEAASGIMQIVLNDDRQPVVGTHEEVKEAAKPAIEAFPTLDVIAVKFNPTRHIAKEGEK